MRSGDWVIENPRYPMLWLIDRMRIKLSINSDHPLLLQTPGGSGAWGGHFFSVNQSMEDCDAWVVYEGIYREESCRCPAGRKILITGEPSEVAAYNSSWLGQFDVVRSVQSAIRHRVATVGHTALPWHLGRGYDFLASSAFPEKDADLSVICSDKAMTSGHRRRLRFVSELLREHPMPRYGRGYVEIADKWEGLARFRYSLAIENSRHPHYWTEKISDCFLAGTVPIYWGAPNIAEYFPKESMIILDQLEVPAALEILKNGVSRSDYQRRLPALLEAKRLVMEKYNLFELASAIAAGSPTSGLSRMTTLRPERRSRFAGLFRRLANFIQS